MTAATALVMASAAIPAAVVLLLQRTLLALETQANSTTLIQLCGAYVLLAVSRAVLLLLRTRWTKGIAWRVAAQLRAQLHRRLLEMRPSQQRELGARLASLTTEVDEVQFGVSAFVTAVRSPLTLVGLGVSAYLVAPDLALWPLLLAPPVAAVAWLGGTLLRKRSTAQRAARSQLLSLAADQLAGLAVIQERQVAAAESERFSTLNQADYRARLALEVDRLLPSALVQVTAAIGVAALLILGGSEVGRGAISASDLVAFAVALGLMSRPLSALSEVWAQGQRSVAALAMVHEALEVAVDPGPLHPTAAPEVPLSLVWRDVHATWGTAPVLSGLSLEIAAGEVVAIVGASGVGKSTLLSLVTRQLDPTAGAVLIGGIDVRALDRRDLSRLVARVSQQAIVFARTIADNLRLAAPEATDERLWQVLEHAGADFVRGLPRGLQTPVEEGGRTLSGGQRQRICLARALLTDAPILLLDEATNQIDAATEDEVISALRTHAAERTLVMVAHDLSTARRADRIVLISSIGRCESGTHAELREASAAYRLFLASAGQN